MAGKNNNCPTCAETPHPMGTPLEGNPNVLVAPYTPPTAAELELTRNFYSTMEARNGPSAALPEQQQVPPSEAPPHAQALYDGMKLPDTSGLAMDPEGIGAISRRLASSTAEATQRTEATRADALTSAKIQRVMTGEDVLLPSQLTAPWFDFPDSLIQLQDEKQPPAEDEKEPPAEEDDCEVEASIPNCFIDTTCPSTRHDRAKCSVSITGKRGTRQVTWKVESPDKQFLVNEFFDALKLTQNHAVTGTMKCTDKVDVYIWPAKDSKGGDIVVYIDDKEIKRQKVEVVRVDKAKSVLSVTYPGQLEITLRDANGNQTGKPADAATVNIAVVGTRPDPPLKAEGEVYSTGTCCDAAEFCISQQIEHFSLTCEWRAHAAKVPNGHSSTFPKTLSGSVSFDGPLPDWRKQSEPNTHCLSRSSQFVNCDGRKVDLQDSPEVGWLPLFKKRMHDSEDAAGKKHVGSTEVQYALVSVSFSADFVTILDVLGKDGSCGVWDRGALRATRSRLKMGFGVTYKPQLVGGTFVLIPTFTPTNPNVMPDAWKLERIAEYDCWTSTPDFKPLESANDLSPSVKSANDELKDAFTPPDGAIADPTASSGKTTVPGNGKWKVPRNGTWGDP